MYYYMTKKEQKGFTLIELLAVIVILAIIALIATPIIVGVINKSKKNAFMDTAYGVVEAGKLYYAKNFGNDNFTGKSFTFPNDAEDLKLSGENPGGGNLEVTDKGRQILAIYDKGKNWCATKSDTEEKVTVTKYEEGKCKTESATEEVKLPAGLTKGTAVYLNPETKSICNETDAVSTPGTKTGCMKWYVYKDNGNGTYQLILDHNTTAKVAWNSTGNREDGMLDVAQALTTDTKTWNVSLNPRLITVNEIAGITGNTTFDSATSTYKQWFFFDSNTQKRTATTKGASAYAWLFDYTTECTPWGCNIADYSTNGYWTSSVVFGSPTWVWNVDATGNINYREVENVIYFGVRPVITV